DGAHANLGRELDRHGAGEFDDSGFGGVVVGVIGISHDAVGGGGLQDDTAASLDREKLPHVTRRGLRYVEHAGEIDGNHFVPFFGSDVEEVVADADTGVVDEDIDCAHHANRFGECSFHLHQVGDVGDDGFRDFRQLVTSG